MPLSHHTKNKGDRAVAHVHADLTERGFLVLFPATEHAPFDLVAYRDQGFLRIQVKFRSAKDGTVQIEFRSGWSDRSGVHHNPMDKAEVDVLAVYVPDTRTCYYVDPAAHESGIKLRLEPAANNQRIGVNLASDFESMPPATL